MSTTSRVGQHAGASAPAAPPSATSAPTAPLDGAPPSAFVAAAGLVIDEVASDRVIAHIDFGDAQLTPWGIVHGGVYASAVETAASVGASAAVAARGMVAVGLTNTTQFLRSVSEGTVRVEGVAMHQGRTHQLWRVDITNDDGALVAHGELRLMNLEVAPRA